MAKVQDDAPELNAQQREWMDRNLDEQKIRHTKIADDMESLSPQRDIWVDGFLERIQTRGFNYNCDALRIIADEELPEKPNRPFKVVF
jgi:hypothetical protein